jgi:hypothetical protein
MKLQDLLMVALTVLLAASEATAELTAEEMRSPGATEEQIEAFRSAEVAPGFPTAQDYLAGGRTQKLQLQTAVASDEKQGVELARAVLWRREVRGSTWPDYAVLNGLSRHTSQRVVDLLSEAAPMYGPKDARWESVRQAWAGAFRRVHGEAAFGLARERVEDPALTAEQRALHLLVFQYERRTEDLTYRSMALEVYRPYLQASEPEVQRSALLVSRGLWDYDALSVLKDVALSSTDIKARSLANNQVKRLLQLGPDPEAQRRAPDGHLRPVGHTPAYDLEGLRAWVEEMQPEWRRENYRLTTGEEPPPGWPNLERPPARYRGAPSADSPPTPEATRSGGALPRRSAPRTEGAD